MQHAKILINAPAGLKLADLRAIDIVLIINVCNAQRLVSLLANSGMDANLHPKVYFSDPAKEFLRLQMKEQLSEAEAARLAEGDAAQKPDFSLSQIADCMKQIVGVKYGQLIVMSEAILLKGFL